ncbi:MAG: alpha/beta hydrolase, partial [Chloroflexi bacterium]|nr:alpha/beta hydrolase [Chloroflexota bacterium]
MKHTEGKFKGHNGLDIYYQYWESEGDPKAVLLVAHGLAEHGGRYKNLVNYFVPKGYAVWA